MVALTSVQITNVTGKNAKFLTHHDYYGHLKQGYGHPTEIGHGETETVYFVFENRISDQSSGAVVYEGENEEGSKFQWLYAWFNRNGEEPDKFKAYTEIADMSKIWDWDYVWTKLINSDPDSHADDGNCVSDAVISQPLCPVIYQGKMSLKGGSKT